MRGGGGPSGSVFRVIRFRAQGLGPRLSEPNSFHSSSGAIVLF